MNSTEDFRGLIIDEPHISRILNGEKTWEMRSSKTKMRGKIFLIRKGSGLIVGEATLEECLKPITKESYKDTQPYHRLEDESFDLLSKWRYPWVLSNAVKYKTPKSYKHPRGAVIWVKLQLKDSDTN